MSVTAIPLFPCRALDDVVPFYEALGFAVAQRQERPNPYAALQWRDAHLHLHGADGASIALFIVDEVEELHATFAAALRQLLGSLPAKGTPRITRMRPGQMRFTLVDPAGNSIYFIRRGEPDPHEETKRMAATQTPLGKLLRAAEVLRDFKDDPAGARKVLVNALRKHADADPAELARAKAMLEDL